MSRSKTFQGFFVLYVLILSILLGLIIQKYTAFQKATQSPTVSFNIEVTEKMSPEKLVSEIYGWMRLDSQRTKSILANTLPHMDGRSTEGILNQVVEPKNVVEHFIYWVAGIDFGKPATYLVNTYPEPDPAAMVLAPVENRSTEEVRQFSTPQNTLIVGANSRIQLNVPPEEMLSYTGERQPEVTTRPPNPNPAPDAGTQPTVREDTAPKAVRKPRILIYHAHTSETYSDDPNPKDDKFHSFLPNLGRITWVGREVARILNEKGFEVVHDTTSYDGEVFGDAYTNVLNGNASKLIASQHFDLVLDIHRDGPESDIRNNCLAKINGKNAAQVMFVIAMGNVDYVSAARQKTLNPLFEQKVFMAGKFAGKMQELYPGLIRDVRQVPGKWYSQQLHPHSMILEVGYQKNKTTETLYTAELVANVIYELFTDDPSLLLD